YDGQDVTADLDGSNALQVRYVRPDVIDGLGAKVTSAGAAGWYLTDRQGSVVNVTDSSGTPVGTIAYDGVGKVTASSGATDRSGSPGREYDAVTQLLFIRRRYYDPETGRWISEDPVRFAAGDANLSRYVFNSYTNATDPSGLAWLPTSPDEWKTAAVGA